MSLVRQRPTGRRAAGIGRREGLAGLRGGAVPIRGRQVAKAAPVQQKIGAAIRLREAQHVSQDERTPGCARAASCTAAGDRSAPSTDQPTAAR
jgi:hypothetical protein